MDFLERIGESYLERKANAIPQKLEDLAKKQLQSATKKKAQPGAASASPHEGKDQEIARLRKQLAEVQLEKGKASARAKHEKPAKKSNGISVREGKIVRSKAPKGTRSVESEVHKKRIIGPEGGKQKLSRQAVDVIDEAHEKRGSAGLTVAKPPEHLADTADAAPSVASSTHIAPATQPSVHSDLTKSTAKSRAGSLVAPPSPAQSVHEASPTPQPREPAHIDSTKSTAKSRAGSVIATTSPAQSVHEASPIPQPRLPTHNDSSESHGAKAPLYVIEVDEEVPQRRRNLSSPGVIEVRTVKGRTLYKVD